MRFPPYSGTSALVVLSRQESLHIHPGVVSGYSVEASETGEPDAEMIRVRLRDGTHISAPPAQVAELHPWGCPDLAEIVRMLLREPEPASPTAPVVLEPPPPLAAPVADPTSHPRGCTCLPF
jgi:hypothetical protein